MMRLLLSTIVLFLCQTYAQPSLNPNWPGWTRIRNHFVFGDSYTTTGFQPNISTQQPNAQQPFGNPSFPGLTFSNGRNWIDFLTYTYNGSVVLTYNFAKGGASVSSFGMENPFRPMDQQVREFFLPGYAGARANGSSNATTGAGSGRPNLDASVANVTTAWRSNNTLFTSFFGINDVNLSFRLGSANMTTLHQKIFATYAQLVDEMYEAGARNFLFLNVPPVHRAPLTILQANGSEALVESNRAAVADFNMRISNMLKRFMEKKKDATVFMLDTFHLFKKVLDDPNSREETQVYSNTTGFCAAYSERTYNESEFKPECRIPQEQYFWLDALHPTPPIHEAMAADIAAILGNNEFFSVMNNASTIPNSSVSPTSNPLSSATSTLSSTPLEGEAARLTLPISSTTLWASFSSCLLYIVSIIL